MGQTRMKSGNGEGQGKIFPLKYMASPSAFPFHSHPIPLLPIPSRSSVHSLLPFPDNSFLHTPFSLPICPFILPCHSQSVPSYSLVTPSPFLHIPLSLPVSSFILPCHSQSVPARFPKSCFFTWLHLLLLSSLPDRRSFDTLLLIHPTYTNRSDWYNYYKKNQKECWSVIQWSEKGYLFRYV